jgi:hypothetical protein
MSEEPASGAGSSESDVLKIYVYGMLTVTAVLIGVVYWLQRSTDGLRKEVGIASRGLTELAKQKRGVELMMGVYEKNKEDEARNQPLLWFDTIRKRKGIDVNSIGLGAWKDPPAEGPGGTSLEERYEIKFTSKGPLSKQKIVEFLHEVERSSARLRSIELSLNRAGKEDALEDDTWTGSTMIGYRRPKMKAAKE